MKYVKLTTLILLITTFSSFGNKGIKSNGSVGSDVPRIVIEELPFSIKNLDYVLQHYDVKHRDIVIKQFILETGWGKSYSFRTRNNLFGLYNSREHDYFSFQHWSESVKGYKNSVQYKYTGGDYYTFLKELPYAEDPGYIGKLKEIKYDI